MEEDWAPEGKGVPRKDGGERVARQCRETVAWFEAEHPPRTNDRAIKISRFTWIENKVEKEALSDRVRASSWSSSRFVHLQGDAGSRGAQ